jgi:hypothetical protein
MARRLTKAEADQVHAKSRAERHRFIERKPTARQLAAAETRRLADGYRERNGEKGLLFYVAAERPAASSTVWRHLNQPDRSPGSKPPGTPRKRRCDVLWRDEMVVLAMHAWWDSHGKPPKGADWSPSTLRKYGHRASTDTRLAVWRAGWLDPDGVWRRFPRYERVPFRRLLEQVITERMRAS